MKKNPLGARVCHVDREAHTRADCDDAAAGRSHQPKFKSRSSAKEALLKGWASGWGGLREADFATRGLNVLQKQRPRGRLSLRESVVYPDGPEAGEKVLSTSIQLAVGLRSRGSSYRDRRMF